MKVLANGNDIKPDVCLISWEKARSGVIDSGPNQRLLLQGGPELAVELRSPSNTRKEEQFKRQQYFENGTQVVWDVDPRQHPQFYARRMAGNFPG